MNVAHDPAWLGRPRFLSKEMRSCDAEQLAQDAIMTHLTRVIRSPLCLSELLQGVQLGAMQAARVYQMQ